MNSSLLLVHHVLCGAPGATIKPRRARGSGRQHERSGAPARTAAAFAAMLQSIFFIDGASGCVVSAPHTRLQSAGGSGAPPARRGRAAPPPLLRALAEVAVPGRFGGAARLRSVPLSRRVRGWQRGLNGGRLLTSPSPPRPPAPPVQRRGAGEALQGHHVPQVSRAGRARAGFSARATPRPNDHPAPTPPSPPLPPPPPPRLAPSAAPSRCSGSALPRPPSAMTCRPSSRR